MIQRLVHLTCERCGQEFGRRNWELESEEAADKWEEWAKENIRLCPDCWREDVKKEEFEEIAKFEKENDLPELKGTPEQVEGARRKRKESYQWLLWFKRDVEKEDLKPQRKATFLNTADRGMRAFHLEDRAEFFIEASANGWTWSDIADHWYKGK